jgi:MoaA/NifB/PqqE/SkfB family radical SAM enzyme
MTLGKPIRLSFTGGEPTVHPLFDELVNYCDHIGIDWISVTTNGTRPAAWLSKQRNDHYVFSLHFEKGWKRVIHNIVEVFKHSEIDIIVNVMAQHDQMDDVREAVNTFLIHSIPFVIRRIRWTESDNRDLFDDMRYKPEDLEWIKQYPGTVEANTVIDDNQKMHANDIIKLNLNQFENWICNAGIESLMINWDGEVYRATCRVDGSLGNIYKDTFSAPSDPVLCSRKFCTCAADIPLTKVKT